MRRTIAFVFTLLFGFFNPGAQADTPAANTAAAAAQKQTIPQRGTYIASHIVVTPAICSALCMSARLHFTHSNRK